MVLDALLWIADNLWWGDGIPRHAYYPDYWVEMPMPYISRDLNDTRGCDKCFAPTYKTWSRLGKPYILDAVPIDEGTYQLQKQPDGLHALYVALARRDHYAGRLYRTHVCRKTATLPNQKPES